MPDVYDKCVQCSKPTKYKQTTHIDKREHYIEGAGQLCPDCYKAIYGRVKNE